MADSAGVTAVRSGPPAIGPEACHGPCGWQRKEYPTPAGGTLQSAENRHRKHGQYVVQTQEEMGDAVVERPEAGGHEIALMPAQATTRARRIASRPTAAAGDDRATLTRRPQIRSNTRRRHACAHRSQCDAPGIPAVDQTGRYSHAMQATRRDYESKAVEQPALAGRQFSAVRMPVKDREESDEHDRGPERRAPFERHRKTQQQCRQRDALLHTGSGTPTSPRKPPIAITSGKVTGSNHIAGAPSWAPQRPTATIATTWSRPETG